MKRFLLRLARLVAIAYVSLMFIVAGCQSRMLYHPLVRPESALLEEAKERGVEPWRDAAGALIGWRIPNPRAKARMLVFHGNAVDAIERAQYLQTFAALGGGMEWETFVMEYPGYGARPGSPGKDAFFAAGRAAFSNLRESDRRPVFLLGESMGGGTACELASENPDAVSGVLLVVPFARLAEVAQRVMPYLPVGLLLHDAYDNIEALNKYHGPVAVVVAANDEVVGADQGRKLYESYSGPKLLIELPDTTHNTFNVALSAPWVRKVDAFLAR